MLNNKDGSCIVIDQKVALVTEKAGTVGGVRIPRTVLTGQGFPRVSARPWPVTEYLSYRP